MSFNTALSGIRAADTDLKVTGNNIANAGTIGFKSSRAEFGDVYTSSLLGGGQGTPGSGVSTLLLRQQFSQGNLKFTENTMDLAVNGAGFFVLEGNDGRVYSRAGAFGLDKDGNIVNSTGANLQGFVADGTGAVSGIINNLRVDVNTQAPRQTTGVEASFNLDANQPVLETTGSNFTTDGTAVGVATLGLIATPVTNGYVPQTLVIVGPTGTTVNYTSTDGASAAQTASEINALAGLTATASTTATLSAAGFNNANGNLELNSVTLNATNIADLQAQINTLSTSTLRGISAVINGGGDLEIVSAVGADLNFSFAGPSAAGSVAVTGSAGGTQTLNNLTDAAVVGGNLDILMSSGFSITSSTPASGNLFAPLTAASFTPVIINPFDPTDPKTYNHATSGTVYDSLGNSHVMRSYFVRQAYDVNDPTTVQNHWRVYVQIDGQDVGDPDSSLPSPANTLPTRAVKNIYFSPDGTLDTTLTDEMLISNWTPLDSLGNPLGTLAPLNVLQGGSTPVVVPPSSSNFAINMLGSTQFGSPFGVENLDQDGYATGRLAGLDVDSSGVLFARFTNGEAQILGQVALANFNNIEGLKPVGNTMWAQTFDTGEAVIGAPGSSSLGAINAGALEESNVDLSEELVNLIIAQRNYQAHAKTIETANATTQTIINLR